jgi:tRNA pseudouridine32 synthase / 23S rRNA pseudouridine746 synthase
MQKIIPYTTDISDTELPEKLNDPFMVHQQPHELVNRAVTQLQEHLKTQTEWQHNFGLEEDNLNKPVGKMFGVLVVQTLANDLGFLAAFSGKLADANHHSYFVPPVFDSLNENEFLNRGMRALKVINDQLKEIELAGCKAASEYLKLKEKRKAHSQALQNQLFEAYKFLNSSGQTKTPNQLFDNPPAGAGECAAPKLLQYAYTHQLKPLAIAEFWWGAPTSLGNTKRIHQQFYPACDEKCSRILDWMLNPS